MRNVMPVALIRASTVGSIRPGGRRGGGDVRGQTIALVSVEDRKAFEKWNRPRFLAGFGGSPLFVARHKTVGVDHRGAAFALADMPAKRERLTESEPALSRKAALDDGTPEN